MLIFFLLKRIIDNIYNIKAKYFEKETLAYDELIKDPRDYELAEGDSEFEFPLPDEFEYIPMEVFNQNIPGYRSSCTAQGTAGAADTIKKYKADKTRISPFTLWDIAKKEGVGREGVGAYLIDTIKLALLNKFIDGYYRILTIESIKKALYRTDIVVTGSNKIDWKQLHLDNYIVKNVGTGSGHAFYLIGWNTKGFIAMNSYSDKYGLKGKFIIPFDLFFPLAFNSTYAVVVDAEWSTLTQDELLDRYSIKTK